MSDFFLRLAARALDRAEAVEPVISSRFAAAPPDSGFGEQTAESPAGTVVAAPGDSNSEAARPNPAATPSRHGDRSVVTRRETAPARRAAPAPRDESDSDQAGTTARAEPVEPSPLAVPPAVMRPRAADLTRMPEASAAPIPEVIPAPRAGEREARRRLFADPAFNGATPLNAAETLAAKRSEHSRGASATPVSEPMRRQDHDDYSMSHGPAIPPPMPHAGRETRRSGPVAQPDPVIEVHIGRIEIHAAPPSPQPALQEAAAPAMSLGDYLKSRSGGGRQ